MEVDPANTIGNEPGYYVGHSFTDESERHSNRSVSSSTLNFQIDVMLTEKAARPVYRTFP
jgi:hypothetical protein